MTSFSKKAIKIGTIFLLCGVLGSFLPAIYVFVVYGAWPGWTGLGSLAAVAATVLAVSWIVQPISYFPALGVAGTYMTWLAGSAGDIRVPCSVAAQQAVGVEQGSPKGEVISTIGVCVSIIVSFTIMTCMVLGGAALISMLPEVVTNAFVYILPAMAGALYTSMIMANKKIGFINLAVGVALYLLLTKLGVTSAIVMLALVIAGIIITIIVFNSEQKKTQS